MNRQSIMLAITFVGCFSIFVSDPALARGILGNQPGDRSPEQNEGWLKTALDNIQIAIEEAEAGNGEKSVEHGKAGMAALKEISSEGWDGKRQRSIRSLRKGVSAARKGKLEKASLKYQDALKRLSELEYGDMNFTHEPFLGIGDHK